MRLTLRGEFILVLALNNLGVSGLFLLAAAVPDAVWSTRAVFVVLGLLYLTGGNWFVVKWWGPNSPDAEAERELGLKRVGLVTRTTVWVLPAWALPAKLVDSVKEEAKRQDMSPSDWVAGALARALGRRSQGNGDDDGERIAGADSGAATDGSAPGGVRKRP